MNHYTYANMEMKKMIEKENLVFTLGTGKLTADQFDEIIKDNDVSILVDVRSKPRGWNRGLWKSSLVKRYGERYHWLGDKLGGFDIDENYGSTNWREGIREILELSLTGRLAIFCAEDDPERCHRSIIANELEKLRFRVINIRGSYLHVFKQD